MPRQEGVKRPSPWLDLPSAGVGPPQTPASPPPAERLLNRDLSWLRFNDRVLGEAADPEVPALERLRFATIVSSNLDEFFMVRVAEIARLARRFPGRRFSGGLTAGQVLGQVRDHVLRQKARQAEAYEDILAQLGRDRVVILEDFGKGRRVDWEVQALLPPVRYVVRRSSEPLPPLASDRIHVFVRFPGEYAVMMLVDRSARLLGLPRRGSIRRFALAERWLSQRAATLFPGREVIEAFPFKLIREADLRYRPDDEETLEVQIAQAVERRSKARVVRLEVDAPSYSEGALFLATSLGLDSAALYRFDLPLDLRTLASLYRLRAPKRLRYPDVKPRNPPPLRRTRSVLQAMRRHDMLLHHPYDSFEPVVRFLSEAARDRAVTRIIHTVYRTSRQSRIMESLKEAARRGKKVSAYVEIKARFEELTNLRWAQELRDAGVRVVSPLGGFKVHSKLTQVFRLENGVERSYLHLGTGNYHEGTARQYTDIGLLTYDQALGREVSEYFAAIAQRRSPAGFRELLVAPQNLRRRLIELIREETALQRSGGRGHIIGKMNALVDPDIISALYDASSAGVKIDLLVRGICCLKPGIKGLSENIRVRSVIDRFLEHSRIYYFRAGGKERMYLSSADWMPRNFYTRYELAFPVKDPLLKRFIKDVILGTSLADVQKAWTLKPDGSYEKTRPAKRDALRSQFEFQRLAERRYRGTVLADRELP